MRTKNTPSPEGSESVLLPLATRVASRAALAVAMAAGLTLGAVAPAAADSPYERGPDPTTSSIEASSGPFDVDEDSVSSWSVSGFGGGTVYYPEDDGQTYGGVVIAPGYTESSSAMAWLGEYLASHGFVAFNIDTNTRYDQPDSRGRQIEAALDYLAEDSDVSDLVDPNRLAAMGHSMGGGGTLAAAEDRPELKAAIPLTPWHTDKTWGGVTVPTMIIGAENDTIAPNSSHSIPFYNSLSTSTERAYVELDGEGHLVTSSRNTELASNSVSWLKVFVDEDDRYEQFLCPAPSTGWGSPYSDYRDSCPYI
ncbi:alpha/beta hydrolase family protein [Nocardiopsis aegyptia]|uniref:Poly(ethylene terephthalate) hydrolase n=1 Tax=Nocardiopsis aegyptia TaxID=220378 RepID=A0A7Z0JAZ5_9ACTN|nr:dienelactone hydrolase [Nocardiopsis aegyptia]